MERNKKKIFRCSTVNRGEGRFVFKMEYILGMQLTRYDGVIGSIISIENEIASILWEDHTLEEVIVFEEEVL